MACRQNLCASLPPTRCTGTRTGRSASSGLQPPSSNPVLGHMHPRLWIKSIGAGFGTYIHARAHPRPWGSPSFLISVDPLFLAQILIPLLRPSFPLFSSSFLTSTRSWWALVHQVHARRRPPTTGSVLEQRRCCSLPFGCRRRRLLPPLLSWRPWLVVPRSIRGSVVPYQHVRRHVVHLVPSPGGDGCRSDW